MMMATTPKKTLNPRRDYFYLFSKRNSKSLLLNLPNLKLKRKWMMAYTTMNESSLKTMFSYSLDTWAI